MGNRTRYGLVALLLAILAFVAGCSGGAGWKGNKGDTGNAASPVASAPADLPSDAAPSIADSAPPVADSSPTPDVQTTTVNLRDTQVPRTAVTVIPKAQGTDPNQVGAYADGVLHHVSDFWDAWFKARIPDVHVPYVLYRGVLISGVSSTNCLTGQPVDPNFPYPFYCDRDSDSKVYGQIVLPAGGMATYIYAANVSHPDTITAVAVAYTYGRFVQDALFKQRSLPTIDDQHKALVAMCYAGVWARANIKASDIDVTFQGVLASSLGNLAGPSGANNAQAGDLLAAFQLGFGDANPSHGGYMSACGTQYWVNDTQKTLWN